ncbi:hypothetical protein V495_04095 [Pseudogymnoascus sp. VKM F-4514 (FW-929)]|nr:hypothetical protein V495_04095 [Pseudogymnoascus sp. VKM F-4514 (FW-929)]KFY64429.1 hypothetical protein V497_01715 [Pseudogymnoascus sp. VKM F-4516 (FW-969)]
MPNNQRLLATGLLCRRPATTVVTRGLSNTPLWEREMKTHGIGSTGKDHITTTKEKKGIYVEASKAGIAARESGDPDTATSERDNHHSNEKAKLENPKAPDPVVGMNDERGYER